MFVERLHPSDCRAALRRGAAAACGAAAGLGFSTVWLLGWPRLRRPHPARVVVSGDSMAPAFEQGDRLVIFPAIRVRAGQTVALRDPRDGRLIVKRVRAARGDLVEVAGDNAEASTDSRLFGPVPRREILGTVIYRYAPAGRVGWRPR